MDFICLWYDVPMNENAPQIGTQMSRRTLRLILTVIGIVCSWIVLNTVALPQQTPQTERSSKRTTEVVKKSTISSAFLDSLQSAGSVAASTTAPTYLVSKVVDGDTIKVAWADEIVTIRMIGVDTPETVDPRKTVQCFGKEASAVTKQLLASSTVFLEIDPTQGVTDKYGRLLAYVHRAHDNLFINKYLIAEGYAHEYTYAVPYQYQAEFKQAEKDAREAQKGLWDAEACAR